MWRLRPGRVEPPRAAAFRGLHRLAVDHPGRGAGVAPFGVGGSLSSSIANKEDAGEAIIGPGLPPVVKDKSKLVTDDCISMPGNVSCSAVA